MLGSSILLMACFALLHRRTWCHSQALRAPPPANSLEDDESSCGAVCSWRIRTLRLLAAMRCRKGSDDI